MFDLNEEISKWRCGLAAFQTLEKSDIDELEGHLREEIKRLMALGLLEQEAFYVARHRLGDTDSLAGEFAKINGSVLWSKRLFWAAVGLFGYIVASYAAQSVSAGFVVAAWFAGVKGYALGVLDATAQVVFFLTVVFLLYVIGRRKDLKGELFCKVVERPWGKLALFAGVLGIIAVKLAVQFLIPATVARLSVEQWGEMAIFRAFTELLWMIGLPLILLTVLILLRPSKLREAGTQS
ncbi:MAG: hypothetical protein JXN61_14580 [Sedimentisphaerales bacterium]|nr:hypothetical protein [Sedimentisphaerales bacterium]